MKTNLIVFVVALLTVGIGVWLLSPPWALIVVGGIVASLTLAVSLIRGK